MRDVLVYWPEKWRMALLEFDDSDPVIAGADASNPSQFTGVSESTCAGGTEGARASRGLDLYQVVVLD